MHWIVQKEVFKPVNFELLMGALDRAGLPFSVVAIPAGTHDLEPDVNPTGKVYVCGAIKMALIATERKWSPGSFLNENFEFVRWVEHLGDELLNHDADVMPLGSLVLDQDSFVRPIADNKAFDGQLFKAADFEDWKTSNTALMGLTVIAATPKEIFREYRLFVVNDTVVTGSQYMQAGAPFLSAELDPEVLEYAQTILERWRPADAHVLDIALTPDGYKVIEFNNIHSSSFYASDVARYVAAIEAAFG